MSNTNCQAKINCTILAILASIILGITAAILSYTGIIAVTPVFLWVSLGISVVYLAILFLTSPFIRAHSMCSCVCSSISTSIAGILGAILISVILLAITFATTSLFGSFLVGALIGFTSLIFASVACLIKCITGCDDAD